MKKPRPDAAWARLTPEKIEKLKHWLFTDQLSYAKAHQRAKEELGYKGSVSSVARFYYRTCHETRMEELMEAEVSATEFAEVPVDMEAMRISTMRLLLAMWQRQMVTEPEKAREWAWVARLSLKIEDLVIRREAIEAQQERNRLRLAALNQQQFQWQYDQIENALKILPELKELERARKAEEGITDYEEHKRINHMQRVVFGQITKTYPENEEEEAEFRKLGWIDVNDPEWNGNPWPKGDPREIRWYESPKKEAAA